MKKNQNVSACLFFAQANRRAFLVSSRVAHGRTTGFLVAQELVNFLNEIEKFFRQSQIDRRIAQFLHVHNTFDCGTSIAVQSEETSVQGYPREIAGLSFLLYRLDKFTKPLILFPLLDSGKESLKSVPICIAQSETAGSQHSAETMPYWRSEN